ncbi:PIN domain-containing protein [Chthonobacter albigriseus]|uniref:PIN domain-containing protein n=1 Tax=Chthonobacter albigriseus TaxID=1683161 RepID=UPI0015EF27B3|nr:PIN domain-containing protein [Chthonobacter albigriseus]
MAEFLVDTSVLSALAPGRMGVPEGLAQWILREEARLFLPAIVLAEIEQGISQLRRVGSLAKAALLTDWQANVTSRFAARILPLDAEVAIELGRMSDRLKADGRHPGLADTVIAATARVRHKVVLTRNLRHFIPTGVGVADPFETTFWSPPQLD